MRCTCTEQRECRRCERAISAAEDRRDGLGVDDYELSRAQDRYERLLGWTHD
jgi:uncharacterized membrane protein YkoI